jgi:hypothetical protein
VSNVDTTIIRRGRRAGYTGTILGALIIATGAALAIGLSSEPALLIGCAAIALLGVLMVAAGSIALNMAKPHRMRSPWHVAMTSCTSSRS